MKVVKLTVNKADVDTLHLTAEGIEGDKPRKPGRHLSLLPERVRRDMDGGRVDDGFCTRKYCENITVSGLEDLVVGTVLTVGSATIEITEAGKHCFDECKLVQEDRRCELPKLAFSAAIRQPGVITLGDTVEIA